MGKKDHGENFSRVLECFAERNFRHDLFCPYDLSVKLTYVFYNKKQFCALVIIK